MTSARNLSRPPQLGQISTSARSLSTGLFNTCVALESGRVYCWGDNQYGQLGNNDIADSTVPVQVSNISNASLVRIGSAHACALLTDQTVQCWGYNASGQLGNGTTVGSRIPVSVVNLP